MYKLGAIVIAIAFATVAGAYTYESWQMSNEPSYQMPGQIPPPPVGGPTFVQSRDFDPQTGQRAN